jgi:ribulose 1,5-bisphosphate synthetase/thiazole synthase
MKKLILPLCAGFAASSALAASSIFVEAEGFAQTGGWSIDTQFVETMGSPYLIAHGYGKPVKDATTTSAASADAGKYRVWVRAKNWVGPWDAEGSPGRFKVAVNGTALAKEFGATGKDWQWEDGGEVTLPAGPVTLALQDLMGFDGRCDAIYLTQDAKFTPPSEPAELTKFRRTQLGLPAEIPASKEYDLVVIGGGYSGMGAAISAARQGLKVALLQNRPVLGGNGSSEIQVWAMGGTQRGLFPHLGEMVEEFTDRASNSPTANGDEYKDKLKEDVVRAEKNIDLFFNTHVYAVKMEPGAVKRIAGVIGADTRSGQETLFRGRFFCDATGFGSIGAWAGAEFMLEETNYMGMSNMWVMKKHAEPVAWPKTPWALPLGLEDFPLPKPLKKGAEGLGPNEKPEDYVHAEWFWESGFYKHPFNDLELIRDWNLRAAYGAISAMKTLDPEHYANFGLHWLAYIGGPREARRIVGDFVLSGEDMVKGVIQPDATFPTTWDQDLHFAKEQYAKKFPENPFISKAVFGKHTDRATGYPVPYRCLYSKDVENMFMAGRCISVDRSSMGSIRVMRTCGMMGEVVGKAAYLCVSRETTPRGVYERYLEDLKELLRQPGAARRVSIDKPLQLPEGFKQPEMVHDRANGGASIAARTGANDAPINLPGLVIDDAQAKATGKWATGAGLPDFLGKGYSYRGAKEAATMRYEFKIAEAGEYEVRMNYSPHENRATNAPVQIESADWKTSVSVNERQPAPLPQGFITLGKFRFEPGKPAIVVIGAGPADGNVAADVVQLLPVK